VGLFIKQAAVHGAFYLSNYAGLDVSVLTEVAGTPQAFGVPSDWTESATALFSLSTRAFSDLPLFIYSALLVAGFWSYIFFQSCWLTALWIIGHECGHRGFSESILVCDTVGWVIHSFLLVPYFSWQISHRRHHSHTGDQSLDEAHMSQHIDSLLPSAARAHGPDLAPDVEKVETKDYLKNITVFLKELHATLLEFNFAHRVFTTSLYCTMGFFLYLVANLSGRQYPKSWILPNHFMPSSPIYSKSEKWLVIMSDVGLIGVFYAIYQAVAHTNLAFVFLMYLMPLALVNYFFVTFTFLHHTHISLPHYSHGRWTYVQGALATIDRDYGSFYNIVWHHITDLHVVHHLFSSIPFYHAGEATERIKPLLGDYYMKTDEENRFFGTAISMWKAIRDCAFVAEDHHPALTVAHKVIEMVREQHGADKQDSFDVKDEKFVEAVLDVKEDAWKAGPHKDGRNVDAEVYWYRTVNY
jgi:omega-6 fatty acid desaturase (delta-12 desaturase)